MDLFGRLANRALGRMPLLQARIGSRFETGPDVRMSPIGPGWAVDDSAGTLERASAELDHRVRPGPSGGERAGAAPPRIAVARTRSRLDGSMEYSASGTTPVIRRSRSEPLETSELEIPPTPAVRETPAAPPAERRSAPRALATDAGGGAIADAPAVQVESEPPLSVPTQPGAPVAAPGPRSTDNMAEQSPGDALPWRATRRGRRREISRVAPISGSAADLSIEDQRWPLDRDDLASSISPSDHSPAVRPDHFTSGLPTADAGGAVWPGELVSSRQHGAYPAGKRGGAGRRGSRVDEDNVSAHPPNTLPAMPIDVGDADSPPSGPAVPSAWMASRRPVERVFGDIPATAAASPASPVIQVTINRLEVRSTAAAESPAEPAQTRTPVIESLSLDDYLASRNGARA
jgi:hypothetical protein